MKVRLVKTFNIPKGDFCRGCVFSQNMTGPNDGWCPIWDVEIFFDDRYGFSKPTCCKIDEVQIDARSISERRIIPGGETDG